MTEFIGGWLLPLTYATGCVLAFSRAQRHWTIARITAGAAVWQLFLPALVVPPVALFIVALGLAPAPAVVALPLVAWVALSFALLYGTQVWLRCYPQGRFARTFYPWAYCGFYLDETFTRLTFKVWPVTLTSGQAQTLTKRNPVAQGDTL